ncbi:MAG UNVERIFIED_CONTAM: hypothetical protein LVR18_00300 [Planctomycetaceae bacterium]
MHSSEPQQAVDPCQTLLSELLAGTVPAGSMVAWEGTGAIVRLAATRRSVPDVTQRPTRGDSPRWFDGGVGVRLVQSSDSQEPVDPCQTLLSDPLAGTVPAGSMVAWECDWCNRQTRWNP